MMYMNDYDLDYARQRFGRGNTPNRLAIVLMVDALRQWTDVHSDGWAYWTDPPRAAVGAMTLIQSTTNAANNLQESTDITDAALRAAVKPVRAFLARQHVTPVWRGRILHPVAHDREVY